MRPIRLPVDLDAEQETPSCETGPRACPLSPGLVWCRVDQMQLQKSQVTRAAVIAALVLRFIWGTTASSGIKSSPHTFIEHLLCARPWGGQGGDYRDSGCLSCWVNAHPRHPCECLPGLPPAHPAGSWSANGLATPGGCLEAVVGGQRCGKKHGAASWLSRPASRSSCFFTARPAAAA